MTRQEEFKVQEIKVRVTPSVKTAIEQAAAAEALPVSTWIRNQILASLYLAGVATAPQVIYGGFRHSMQDMADNLEEVMVLARALPALIERVMAASMVAGGLNPLSSAQLAEQLMHEAVNTAAVPMPQGE